MSKFNFSDFKDASTPKFTFSPFDNDTAFEFSEFGQEQEQAPPALPFWEPGVKREMAGTTRWNAPLIATDKGQPVEDNVMDVAYFMTFKQVFPNQARRVEQIADDPSTLLAPWKRAVQNIRAYEGKPIYEPGLDWGAMGNWLKEGGKAILGTFGENIGPILHDVNIPSRVLGPMVEAVAQTEESALYTGPVDEFILTVQKSPEIAKRWWEIFRDVQLGDAEADLVKQSVAAYVEKGAIKPENAPYLAALFSIASNPVIMHSALTRDLPALGRAIEKRFPGSLAKMQAKGSLIEKGVDINSRASMRTALSGWKGKLTHAERAYIKNELSTYGFRGRNDWFKGQRISVKGGGTGLPHGEAWQRLGPPLDTRAAVTKAVRPEAAPISVVEQAAPTPVAATKFQQPAWFQPTGLVGPAKEFMGAEIVDALAVAAQADMLATREPAVPETPPAPPPAAPDAQLEAAMEKQTGAPEAAPEAPAPEAPVSQTAERIAADDKAYMGALDTAISNSERLPPPPDYPDDERAPELPVKYIKIQPAESGVSARLTNLPSGTIRNPVIADVVKETGADLYIERDAEHDNLYAVADGKIVAAMRRGMRGWRPRLASITGEGTQYEDMRGQAFSVDGTASIRETDSEAIDDIMADLASMKIRGLDDELTKFYGGLPPANELWDMKTEFVNWIAGMAPPSGLRTRSDIANTQIGALMGDVFGVLNKHEFMAARARDYWLGQSERLRNYIKHPALLKGKLSNIWRGTPLTDTERMEVYRGVEDPDAKDLSEWQRKEAGKFAERMNHYFDMAAQAGLMDTDWFRDNYFSHVIVSWSEQPGGTPMPAEAYGRYAPGWKKKQFFQHRRRLTGTIEEMESNGVPHAAPDGSTVTLYPNFVKDPAVIEPLYVMALGRGVAMQSVMSGLYGLPTATGYNGVVNKDVFGSMPENTRNKYRPLDIAGLSKWRVIDRELGKDGKPALVRLAEQELYINKELHEPLAKLADVPIDEPMPVVGPIWGKLASVAKRATLFLTPVHFATLLSYALVAPSGLMPHPVGVAKTMSEFGSLWERDDPELVEAVEAGLPLPQLGSAEVEIRRGLRETATFKEASGVVSEAFKRFTDNWVGSGLYKAWRTLKLPLDAWDFILFDRLLGAAVWENYKYARDFYAKDFDRHTAVRMAVEEASTFMGALQKIMTTRKGDYWSRRAFLASSFRRANIDTFVKGMTGKGYGWKYRPVQGEGGTGEGGGPHREPPELRKLQNQVARRATAKIAKGILWAIVAADIQTVMHYLMRWREEGKRPDSEHLWNALKRNASTGGIHVYTTDFDRSGRGLRHVNVVFRPMTEIVRWLIRPAQQAVSVLNPFTRATGQLAGNVLDIEPSVDPNLPPKRRAIEMTKDFLRNTTFYGRMPYELGGSEIPRTPKEHFLVWVGIYPSAYEPNEGLLKPMRQKEAVLAADRADARVRAWKHWLEGDDPKAMEMLTTQYPPKRVAEIMKDFGKMSRTWWTFRQLPADQRMQWFVQMPPEEQDAFLRAVAEEMFIRAQQEAKLREKAK